MKIKFLLAGLLGMISITALAQKGELSNAQKALEQFESLSSANAGAFAKKSLTEAKTAIDKAAANDKTAALPQTYALKGAIYSTLSNQDTIATTSLPLYTTAEEAYNKAIELDTKGEFKSITDPTKMNLAQYKLTQGVNEFRDKKYDLAYVSFDRYRQYTPEDTNAIYYTGLAAANMGNLDAAIAQYKKLVTTKYSKSDIAYFDLSNFYLNKKDTVAALEAVTQGIAKYPTNMDLKKRQIEIYLQTGRQQEVLSQIQSAIAADPKNKTLYYYAGITYGQFADALTQEIKALKDPAAKAKLKGQRAEQLTKAAEMYKKALEIDPGFFDANLNMGYVLLTPAIELYNETNKLPANKQKEFDAGIAKSKEMFAAAKPYLLKAVEIDPKSTDALTNLRTYYLGVQDTTNANEIKKRIDALQ